MYCIVKKYIKMNFIFNFFIKNMIDNSEYKLLDEICGDIIRMKHPKFSAKNVDEDWFTYFHEKGYK